METLVHNFSRGTIFWPTSHNVEFCMQNVLVLVSQRVLAGDTIIKDSRSSRSELDRGPPGLEQYHVEIKVDVSSQKWKKMWEAGGGALYSGQLDSRPTCHVQITCNNLVVSGTF